MFTLDKKHAALAPIAADEGTRYVLHGIHVEVLENGDGAVRLTATDGKALLSVKHTGEREDHIPEFDSPNGLTEATIPAKELAKALKSAGSRKAQANRIPVSLGEDVRGEDDVATIHSWDGETQERIKTLDGNYPKYQEVVPDASQAEFVVSFNPALLAKVLKSMADLKAGDTQTKSVKLHFIADNRPLLITGACDNGDEITAVAMPYRLEE